MIGPLPTSFVGISCVSSNIMHMIYCWMQLSPCKWHLILVTLQSAYPRRGSSAVAEIYLRYGAPPFVMDLEDYVQWEFDKYYSMKV